MRNTDGLALMVLLLTAEAKYFLAKRKFNGIIHVQPSVFRINSFSRRISVAWNQALGTY